MARIRSIHPGLFTDENYVELSPLARLLVICIWCESWDDGVFEWKAKSLKIRYFPCDNVDVESLLEELVQYRFVKRFESDGKGYGAVRNFGKFQSPRKPNSSGVLPKELRTYVTPCNNGSSQCETSTVPVPYQSRTNTEPVPLGEGEGEGEGKGSDESPLRSDSSPTGRKSDDFLPRPNSAKNEKSNFDAEFENSWWPVYPHKVGKGQAIKAFRAARKLASLEALVAGVDAYKRTKPTDRPWRNPATWLNGQGWLDAPAEVNGKPVTAPPPPMVELRNGRQVARKIVVDRCVKFFQTRQWSPISAWGDSKPPIDPDTIYPTSCIDEARKIFEQQEKPH